MCDEELPATWVFDDAEPAGRERLLDLGLEHTLVPAAGTSEDVAMLMSYEKGADLIVTHYEGRPIRIRGRSDMPVGEFQVEPRAGADAGSGVQGAALLVANQRKAARQHAAIR